MPDQASKAVLLTPQALAFIHRVLGAEESDLRDVMATQAGMTNRSFRFSWGSHSYILRVPGEGTDQLINRRQEAAVYAALAGDPITDEVLALDPETGYKLTKFWPSTHNCDPNNPMEVRQCMVLLRQFHEKALQVPHSFQLYREISFYESLRQGPSVYPDYDDVRLRCFAMGPFLRRQNPRQVLSHIDAVSDNFLFVHTDTGQELHLIDWEYAGMHDPHVDIAMFAIYAGYDRDQIDQLIDWYFGKVCPDLLRLKIYCYVALAGLLWSNWCEYKKALGVEFGGYALMQYRYASEYSSLFSALISKYSGGSLT